MMMIIINLRRGARGADAEVVHQLDAGEVLFSRPVNNNDNNKKDNNDNNNNNNNNHDNNNTNNNTNNTNNNNYCE